MNNDFWLDRWSENKIGFHRPGTQPLLEKYWSRIARGSGRVLVPLCGKTHDLLWLAARGHPVVGIELSDIAAQSFATEHGLEFDVVDDPPFTRRRSDAIELWVGDFFDAIPERVGRFPMAYDRAALIALPPDTRPLYVRTLKDVLYFDAHILLITIEWDMDIGVGPPWGVDETEVRRLYAGSRVERLESRDCLDEEPRFRDRGATWMREVVYQIRLAGSRVRPG